MVYCYFLKVRVCSDLMEQQYVCSKACGNISTHRHLAMIISSRVRQMTIVSFVRHVEQRSHSLTQRHTEMVRTLRNVNPARSEACDIAVSDPPRGEIQTWSLR